ncbi:CitMHS family transporter [Clostridium polynesiense]|uniref:CitMHS family transporter n=1 Tax=Clostridium polynesiense TaxID=1325933 RepID=UPI0009E5D141|nr:citrate:proton symporter [Clostridium polynesiense]
MLTFLGYGIVITFMIVIMAKKMSAMTSLILIPVVFAAIGGFGLKDIGKFCKAGIGSVAPTAAMLLFAIMFFGLMINAGLFDPLVNWAIKKTKGDPVRILVATAILAAVISLDGDGTTTTMICCTALVPIYKKLDLKLLYLATIIILQNSIMNLLPWGGPTARVMSALKLDGGEILRPLVPGMIIAAIYVVGVAYILGRKERKRLGHKFVDETAIAEIAAASQAELSEEDAALKRPKLIWVNLILTLLVVFLLVEGTLPAVVIFEIGTALALIINYKSLKLQRELIENHAGSAIQVIIMVLAAGIFMGILTGSGMAEAIALSMTKLIPEGLAARFPLITAIISIPGTFLLSNDAFYYGVLPILAETGAAYGFTSLQIGVASVMGQAFHLLSPLVAFIYLLLQLTEVDMGEWQRFSAKWAIGVFVIFVGAAVATGAFPL